MSASGVLVGGDENKLRFQAIVIVAGEKNRVTSSRYMQKYRTYILIFNTVLCIINKGPHTRVHGFGVT